MMVIIQTKVQDGTQISPKRGYSTEAFPRIRLRDGRQLAYVERGFPKDKEKFKIIIVHGFGSTKRMYFPAPQVIISVSLSEKNENAMLLVWIHTSLAIL